MGKNGRRGAPGDDGPIQQVTCFWCGSVYDLAYHRRCPDCAGSASVEDL